MTTHFTPSQPSETPLLSAKAFASRWQSGEPPQIVLPADPLDFDRPDDPVVLLSHRQIGRLVFVSAETGARFAREGSPQDPAAWMCAPRRLFGGRNAVSACTDREMFMRALVLHGVSPVLDMEPEEMDVLLGDAHDVPVEELGPSARTHGRAVVPPVILIRTKALFTATFVDETQGGISHFFYAAVAADEDAVREQLRARVGGRISHMATVDRGFDPSEPVALSLLSDAAADLLRQIDAIPDSPLSAGFSLFVEHRFDA